MAKHVAEVEHHRNIRGKLKHSPLRSTGLREVQARTHCLGNRLADAEADEVVGFAVLRR
jgi:hypothetical protein